MGLVGKAKQPDPEPDEERDDGVEQRQVFWWRRRQALQAGMSPLEARLFAESSIETKELRRLVDAGCPGDMIGRILL